MNQKQINPRLFDEQKEAKEKRITNCVKCNKKMTISEGDYTEEKIKTLNFMCSDCTHNEIIEKELQLEKEIISQLDINPEKKYSTTEAAKRLGICSITVQREIKRGEIRAETGKGKIKPRYSILGKELIEYAKNRHKQKGGINKSPKQRFSAPTHIKSS